MTTLKFHPWLLMPSILAVSIGFAFNRANAAERTLIPSPPTVHIGHFSVG
jgi:hypothetical protein